MSGLFRVSHDLKRQSAIQLQTFIEHLLCIRYWLWAEEEGKRRSSGP